MYCISQLELKIKWTPSRDQLRARKWECVMFEQNESNLLQFSQIQTNNLANCVFVPSFLKTHTQFQGDEDWTDYPTIQLAPARHRYQPLGTLCVWKPTEYLDVSSICVDNSQRAHTHTHSERLNGFNAGQPCMSYTIPHPGPVGTV